MSAFFAITLVIILAAISPGPDFAVVTKNSLLYSRRSGIFTALGVSVSLLIHSSYCVLGLAIVIAKSLLIFSLIKYVCASYLIYLGIKSLFAKRSVDTSQPKHSKIQLSAFRAFRQGLLCNLLNPKAIMFLLAFFTLVVTPATTPFTQIIYVLDIGTVHFVWFSLLTVMITHRHIRSKIANIQHYIVKSMGVVLIAFGARIATLHQKIA